MPEPSADTKWKVAFTKPQDINLVGGWNTKLLVKRKDNLPYVVDLAVEMPDVSLNIFIRRSILTLALLLLVTVPREGLSQQSLLSQKGVLPGHNRGCFDWRK